VSIGAGGHGSGSANTLTIDQSSQNAIVNWQSFSIGANGTVNIVQPNAGSALLNRVTGNAVSTLAGHLDANGQVYLINPNGIAITKSGVVDVGGGFVASTLGISDDDFRNGKLSFTGTGSSAGVTNQGVITVGRGGYAALLGGSVNNAGLIAVPLGKVGLGSGEAATLDVSGDGFLQVAVPTVSGGAGCSQGSGTGALIQSSGTISANGGMVVLSAATARSAARNAVNLSGVVEAHSISGHDGAISLGGGPGGTVQISATLDVSGLVGSGMSGGTGELADGGTIAVTGQNISLTAARLNASGANGGSIDIGGEEHGGGTLPTADRLSVDAGTVITADALGTNVGAQLAGSGAGQGGSVVLWSNEDTIFAGKISAAGAVGGGNGGDAEVSSKNLLQYSGLVDLKAPHGAFGTLLLDPYNITIQTGTTTGGTFSSGTFTAPSSNSILSVTDLQNALANASVTVSTGGAGSAGSDAGNITVANALTWASGSTLTLSAYHSIAIDAGITISGGGGLALTTNNGGSGGTLTFGTGFGSAGSVQFTSAGNSGRSLTINSTAYTLVDTMAELDAIDAVSAVDGSALTRYGAGLAGNYALAVPLTATGTTYTTALIGTNSSGTSSTQFTGTFEGLGNTITGLTISNSTGNASIGLFGVVGAGGTVRDVGLLGGSVTGTYGSSTTGGYNMGELVGYNQGTVLQSYATGNVTITQADTGDYIGGLVGFNGVNASITSSYATGAVGNNDNTVAGGQIGGLAGANSGAIAQCFATGAVSDKDNGIGGLVGFNYSQASSPTATITNSYATGAVLGTTGSAGAGGLVGTNSGAITYSYSTGMVSGGAAGGLVWANGTPGNGTTASISNSYWDATTSGNGTSATGSTSQTTTQLQGALPSGFSSSYWATGTGMYPYLTSIYPSGAQAISGIAYKNSTGTTLTSGSNGPGLVSVTIGGVAQGAFSTGNNGYYYLAVPAGMLASSGTPVLAYTQTNANTGAANGDAFVNATGSVSALYVYGTLSRFLTAAGTYSASGFATANPAVLGYTTTPSFFSTLTPNIIPSGSFTLDSTLNLTASLGVQTSGSSPITVSAPITLSTTTLTLNSGNGALDIEAPITVTGSGTVALTAPTQTFTNNGYSTSPVNLNFPAGGSVQFTGGSSGSPQGTLTINGNGYTLINSMTGLTGMSLTGRYALATALTSGSYTNAPIAPSSTGYPYTGTKFTGTLEGLGNTVTGFTINQTTGGFAGLFGGIGGSGTVRDLGLVGGSISSTSTGGTTGFLAGENDGTVYGVYETGPVAAGGDTAGGLVGYNFGGYIIQSYATGSATGTGDVGGLVGHNSLGSGGVNEGMVTRSYATGTVSLSGSSGSHFGGLVGSNETFISYSYATGAVDGSSVNGGLVGVNNSGATVTDSYSTGTVYGTSTVGGFVGTNSGTVSSSYWDTTTTGLSTGIASGTTTGATGVSTANLQNSANPSSVALGSAFAGGAAGTSNGGTNGTYPYLTALFPNGIQAVSGIAYRDAGIAPYASTSSGAGEVSVTVGGVLEGTPDTGVNGYYYLVLPANTILSTGSNVLAFTQSGTGYNAMNGESYAAATGTVTGLNIYGGYSAYNTSATLYSQAVSSGSTLLSTVTGYSTTPTLSNLGSAILATGASFTVDQSLTPSSNLALFTSSSSAPLIVAQPITVSGSNTLTLGAGGALEVDANVTVTGAGTVSLSYNTSTALGNNIIAAQNFGFGPGDSLQFTGGTSGSPQGTLSIAGTSYTLINSMTQLAATGLSSNTALAIPLTAPGTAYTAALIGSIASPFTGTFEGLGNTVTGLDISSTTSSGSSNTGVGLFGSIGSAGTVRDLGLVGGTVQSSGSTNVFIGELAGNDAGAILQSYATGAVSLSGTGGNTLIGDLVGNASGTITASYATGAVTGSSSQNDGGLAGRISGAGTISQSFATGAVQSGGSGGTGGLVGRIDGGSGVVQYSYATGAVTITGGGAGNAGGLVGQNNGQINYAYATGEVTNASTGASVGGVTPSGAGTGTQTDTYWDKQTSGITATGPTGTTGETTTQLQGSVSLTFGGAFTGGAAGGTSGIYPYLTTIYPNGVQAVSGIAYKDAGSMPLVSTTTAAALVSVMVGGTAEGTVSTGNNGYYYLLLPAGTISSSGSTVLAYTAANSTTGAKNAATLATETGTTSGFNIYGGDLLYTTSALLYSTAVSNLNAAETAAEAASSGPASSVFSGLTPSFTATGSSFTLDQALSPSGSFSVQTTATNAPITVAQSLTLATSSTLTLDAAGALAIDAPITVNGTGAVALTYNTASPANFTFAQGDSINYGTTSSGGSLSINGQSYHLLYNLTDSGAATGNGTDSGTDDIAGIDNNSAAGGDNGYYALATNVTGTGSASAPQFAHPLAGSGGHTSFNGVFEGLGHTITDLTISDSADMIVGLFGTNGGTVRDLGLVGGSVASSYSSGGIVGGLVGVNNNYANGGTAVVANVYNTGSVSVTNFGSAGGLVGDNLGYDGTATLMNSYATGAVSSGGNGSYVGGLVGTNNGQSSGTATITNAYASGAVTGGANAEVGGIVAQNASGSGTASVNNVYATGAVTSAGGNQNGLGGIVGSNSGSVSNAYWDYYTGGSAPGIGSAGSSLATAALQSSATSGVSLSSAFAGGAVATANGGTNGVYPYLASFFPNGVQAISGFAYTGIGTTPLASRSAGAAVVGVSVAGVLQGTASTGINGYYYVAMPANTLSSTPSTLVAYSTAPVSSQDGATLTTASLSSATGAVAGPSIYGGYLNFSTSATTYSAANTAFTSAQGTVAGVTGSSFESALAPFVTATGASFTFDQTLNLSSNFAVQTTTSNAPITVSAPITLSGANALTLYAAGAIAIDAPITVSGAGAVSLTYDSASPTNLTFAAGSSIDYGTSSNGGSLSINGQSYTLLYKLTDSSAATGNGPDSGTDDVAGIDANSGAQGDNGYYALATNLTGTGSATAAQFSAPLVGSGSNSFNGVFEGLGHTVTNLTISDSTDSSVGLFGTNGGTIRDLGLVSGSVNASASGAYVGALAGQNGVTTGATALIVNAYSNANVSGAGNGALGGLVGANYESNGAATVENSYATGAVSGGSYSNVGGLVGSNLNLGSFPATIQNAYATGAVTGGFGSDVGGLAGDNRDLSGNPGQAIIQNVYATGAVSGGSYVGGVVGYNSLGTVSAAYWDVGTSGTTNGKGGGASVSAQGLTTAALQSSSTSGVSLSSAFAGGAVATANGGTNGVYPYLASFFPNGVQAISGFAYSGIGTTPLASGTSGAALVGVNIGGVLKGTVSTGANGYYYVVMPASTLSSTPATLVAYSTAPSSSQDGATLTSASLSTATGAVAGPSIYGGYLNFSTSATTYSAANTAFTSAQSTVAGVTGSSFELGLAPFVTATGASFTFNQSLNLSSSFAVQTTTSGAPITVSSPITLGATALTLEAAGALRFDAPVTITGAGTVILAYNTASAQNLGFGIGDGLQFTGTNSDGSAQGSLSINGTAYTLVNSTSEMDAIDATSAVNGSAVTQYGSGLGGAYALAGNLNASGTTYTTALVGTNSSGTSSTQFSGTFEGLGNTISGLTIDSSNTNVGLFGFIASGGSLRDIGLVGGSITGTASYTTNTTLQYGTGSLAGENAGLITQSYSSAAVNGSNDTGGLVGRNDGSITYAFATGAVTAANSPTYVGGFVGVNDGTITDAYAMGAVTAGGTAYDVGGFVGDAIGPHSNTISFAFSTGEVTAASLGNGSTLSGFYGTFGTSGGMGPTITQAYWDSTTSYPTLDMPHNLSTNLTTAQLQGTASLPNGVTVSLTGFSGGAAGGTSGIYPYLSNFYPNGVQTISGLAYKDAGATVLASGTSGAGLVSVATGGALLGTASTGRNGYYYVVLPAGTLAANQGAVAFTQANVSTGALDAAQFMQSSGGTSSTISVYGGWLLERAGTLSTLSALDAAYASAVGSTAAASLAPANVQITGSGAFGIDTSLTASGTVLLSFTGAVSETGGAALSAANLLLAGSGGSYTLGNANSIGTLAASTGSVSLVDTASLTTGSLNGAAGAVTTGVTTTGTVSLISSGSLTIASGDTVSGQSPVLAAAGAFINDQGADAVTATSSTRWLIYSSSPSADTFDALNSANTAIFDATYSSLAPGSVTQGGNRYLFANQPTLTVTSTSDTKTYGVDDSSSIAGDYTLSGSFPSVSGVFLADSMGNAVSGAPAVSSSGSSATAPVIGSPYVIDVAQGTLSSSSGYGFTYVNSGSLTVNPVIINLTGTRVYDANTDAAASVFESNGSIAGVAGQLLTLSGTGTLAGKNVGNETFSSLGTLTLGNGGSGGTAGVATNYTLVGGTDAVNVTALGITVTATANNKPYDTTTAATVTLASSGVLGSDQVSFSDTSATFSDANAATGKTVTVSGLGLGGTDGGNYTISNANATATTTANIAPAIINLSGTRVYDANTDAAASLFESNGSIAGVAGQLLTLSGTGTLAGKNVGSESLTSLGTLTLGNGGSSGTAGVATNYTLVGGTDAVNVTALGITVSATAANKVYDATNAATVTLSSSGVLGNDQVTFSDTSATFNNANAGNGKTVTVSGISTSGTDGGNYTISNANDLANTMANISPAVINLSGTRVYDANTDAAASVFESNGSIAGVAGQLLTLTGSATLAGKNVGSESLTSLGTLTLSNGGSGGTAGVATNYTLLGGTDAVNVTPLGITVTATADNKPYDTTTAATVSLSSSGVLGNDQVTFIDTSATFNNANAGNGKTVTVSGISTSGTDGGNYTISNANDLATTTANISPAVINLSGTRVYDANTDAAASVFESNGSIAGLAGQLLTLSGTGTLAGKNVGNEAVTALGTLTLGNGGSGGTAGVATNYTLVGGTESVTVTPKELSLNLQGRGDKVYDGTTSISLNGITPTLEGVFTGDIVALSTGSVTGYVTKDAGNDKPVTFTGFALSGSGALNYVLVSGAAPSTADVTPAPITAVTGISANNKTYDGTVGATLNTGGAAFAGQISGDVLNVASANGAFTDKNVGTGKTVDITGITLGGADAGDYLLTSTSATATANITPRNITVTASGADKVYDGTTAATVTLASSGVLSGDTVSFTDTSAAFDTRNVGSAKTVTVSGIGTAGTDGGNYAINNPNATATTVADITPATITVTGATGVNKPYDGTTALPARATGFTSGGVLAIDAGAVTITAGSDAYASPHVGPEAIDVSGLTLSGSAAGNYVLSATSVTGSGTITAANGGGGSSGGGSSGGGGTSGGSGSGSISSGKITLPSLTSGGSGGAGGSGDSGTYVLSGTPVSSTTNRNGTTTTVVGSISNGVVMLNGTFIIQPRAGTDGSLPDEIASNATEIVTFMQGTLSAQLSTDATGNGFASTAAEAAWNEDASPFQAMPVVFSSLDDPDRPWEAIDTLGNPGFDQTIVCVRGHCALVPSRTGKHSGVATVSH
jgi:filamentous hemagglutinin family protein